MDDRCLPPPALADRDGWHWLTGPYDPMPGWWDSDEKWWVVGDNCLVPESAHKDGWRYVAPVAPPEEVAALRELIEALRQDRNDKFEQMKAERNATLAALRTHTPYGERCRDPLACHATGRCPRDPVCGE